MTLNMVGRLPQRVYDLNRVKTRRFFKALKHQQPELFHYIINNVGKGRIQGEDMELFLTRKHVERHCIKKQPHGVS